MKTSLSYLLAGLCTLSTAVAQVPDAPNAQTPLRYYYLLPPADPPQVVDADVCVYGGTTGGVTAAIASARMGKKTVLVEFGPHIGGITSSGLSATDGGQVACGIGREFYDAIGNGGFHPAAAEQQFRRMLASAGVTVYTENRLVDVEKPGDNITEIQMENGNRFHAKIFIDATYEGDLMALAGVSYHIGREANSVYNESNNGVYLGNHHQFNFPVDPYVTPGDPKSGLLPTISDGLLGTKGDGDGRMQAYNFRMSFEAGGLPFPKPAGYDPKQYELLLRFIQAGGTMGLRLHRGDVNNDGGFSTDNIGANYDWPDGAGTDYTKPVPIRRHTNFDQVAYSKTLYQARELIYQNHVTYQQGFCYFLANDPQVPAPIQAEMAKWGLTRADFVATGGWPHQLYVREGRRMMSDYVMTEHNAMSELVAEDSIGVAIYGMDSHNARRLVVKGQVKNEGNVEVKTPHAYPVSYRAIVPKQSECTNLLVPVAVSSSHIGYSPIRMEPVFLELGQSAGTAAALAIDANIPVQKIDYPKLQAQLLQDKMVLDPALIAMAPATHVPVTTPPAPAISTGVALVTDIPQVTQPPDAMPKKQGTPPQAIAPLPEPAPVAATANPPPPITSTANADSPAVSTSENWENVSADFTKQIGADVVMPTYQQRCNGMIVTPNGDIVIQTTREGICVSRDQGATWSVVANNNIKGTSGNFVMPFPYDGRMVLFGFDGAGGMMGGLSLDDAKTWRPMAQVNRGVKFGDLDWSVPDPQMIFGLTHEPYFSVLSDDGGKSWQRIDSAETGKGPETNYCLGVLDGKTLLRGNLKADGIESSNDSGATWSQVTNYRTLGRQPVHYGRNLYWATTQGIIMTPNGKDWTPTGPGAEGVLFGPYFGSSEQEFVVVTEKEFLKTEDGGKTWNSIAKFYKAPGTFRNLTAVCYFGWDPKHNILYASGLGTSVYRLKL